MTRDMEVATTILAQLGGSQFCMMTGACNLVAVRNGLQFSIGSGAKDGINKVLIVLEPGDTYSVEFWTIRRVSALRHSRHEDIYCDVLADVFERETGFFTTLHPRR